MDLVATNKQQSGGVPVVSSAQYELSHASVLQTTHASSVDHGYYSGTPPSLQTRSTKGVSSLLFSLALLFCFPSLYSVFFFQGIGSAFMSEKYLHETKRKTHSRQNKQAAWRGKGSILEEIPYSTAFKNSQERYIHYHCKSTCRPCSRNLKTKEGAHYLWAYTP